MTVPESAAPHIVTIVGERIALGPERRDLMPLMQRWHNDFTALRSLGDPPVPQTLEQASTEYDHHVTIPDMVRFLIYERATWRPIGLTLLHGIDYRQGTATYVILIGEADCRGRGYGTEATRLMLDYAFTALGLHSVILTAYAFNIGGLRAYQKAGFNEIGRWRESYVMGGRRWDTVYMDCLACEFTSPLLHSIFAPDVPRASDSPTAS